MLRDWVFNPIRCNIQLQEYFGAIDTLLFCCVPTIKVQYSFKQNLSTITNCIFGIG